MATTGARASKRAYWTQMLQQWKVSGLSQNKFAASVGINGSSLSNWNRVLHKADAKIKPIESLPAFLPLQVQKLESQATSPLLLSLKNNIHLTIPSNVDKAALKTFLEVLGVLPC